jgi:hypothetical protein
MQDKICSLVLSNRQLPSLRYGHTIVLPSHQVRKETTSTEACLVTCLKWLGKHRAAQIPSGDGKGFHNRTLRRFVRNHGYKARVELIARSYDLLRGLRWL